MRDADKYRIVRTENGDIYQAYYSGHKGWVTHRYTQFEHETYVLPRWRNLKSSSKLVEKIKNCAEVQIIRTNDVLIHINACNEFQKLYPQFRALESNKPSGFWAKIKWNIQVNSLKNRVMKLYAICEGKTEKEYLDNFPKYTVEHRMVWSNCG